MRDEPAMRRTILFGFALGLVGSVLMFSVKAEARGAYALYQFTGSHDSQCVPRVSNPDETLSRNGISTRGATPSERQSLANGIAKIQSLLGGRTLPLGWRTPYTYITSPKSGGRYTWNQAATTIFVRRPAGSTNGQNETRLVHELGHKVGNAGAYAQYSSFTRGKNPCRISPYCQHGGRNEEFAEAFAAFVTRPSHLKTVCPDAYAFFSTRLFPGSNAVASCGDDTNNSPVFMASSGSGSRPQALVDDGYDRRQCNNILCWLFGINRNYRTQGSAPQTSPVQGPAGTNSEGTR